MDARSREALFTYLSQLEERLDVRRILDDVKAANFLAPDLFEELDALSSSSNSEGVVFLVAHLTECTAESFPAFTGILKQHGYEEIAEALIHFQPEAAAPKTDEDILQETLQVGGIPFFLNVIQRQAKIAEIRSKINTLATATATVPDAGQQQQAGSRVLVVNGIGGSGKTTLVADCLRSVEWIKQGFRIMIWKSVGYLKEYPETLREILIEELTEEAVSSALQMRQSLVLGAASRDDDLDLIDDEKENNKVLLVLDDFWDVSLLTHFEGFADVFVVITRDKDVASQLRHCTVDSVSVPLCSDDEAKSILLAYSGVPAIGEDVLTPLVKYAEGLPLGLALTGMLIRKHSATPESWKQLVASLPPRTPSPAAAADASEKDREYAIIAPIVAACLDDIKREINEKKKAEVEINILDLYLDFAALRDSEIITGGKMSFAWAVGESDAERLLMMMAERGLVTRTGKKMGEESILWTMQTFLDTPESKVSRKHIIAKTNGDEHFISAELNRLLHYSPRFAAFLSDSEKSDQAKPPQAQPEGRPEGQSEGQAQPAAQPESAAGKSFADLLEELPEMFSIHNVLLEHLHRVAKAKENGTLDQRHLKWINGFLDELGAPDCTEFMESCFQLEKLSILEFPPLLEDVCHHLEDMVDSTLAKAFLVDKMNRWMDVLRHMKDSLWVRSRCMLRLLTRLCCLVTYHSKTMESLASEEERLFFRQLEKFRHIENINTEVLFDHLALYLVNSGSEPLRQHAQRLFTGMPYGYAVPMLLNAVQLRDRRQFLSNGWNEQLNQCLQYLSSTEIDVIIGFPHWYIGEKNGEKLRRIVGPVRFEGLDSCFLSGRTLALLTSDQLSLWTIQDGVAREEKRFEMADGRLDPRIDLSPDALLLLSFDFRGLDMYHCASGNLLGGFEFPEEETVLLATWFKDDAGGFQPQVYTLSEQGVSIKMWKMDSPETNAARLVGETALPEGLFQTLLEWTDHWAEHPEWFKHMKSAHAQHELLVVSYAFDTLIINLKDVAATRKLSFVDIVKDLIVVEGPTAAESKLVIRPRNLPVFLLNASGEILNVFGNAAHDELVENDRRLAADPVLGGLPLMKRVLSSQTGSDTWALSVDLRWLLCSPVAVRYQQAQQRIVVATMSWFNHFVLLAADNFNAQSADSVELKSIMAHQEHQQLIRCIGMSDDGNTATYVCHGDGTVKFTQVDVATCQIAKTITLEDTDFGDEDSVLIYVDKRYAILRSLSANLVIIANFETSSIAHVKAVTSSMAYLEREGKQHLVMLAKQEEDHTAGPICLFEITPEQLIPLAETETLFLTFELLKNSVDQVAAVRQDGTFVYVKLEGMAITEEYPVDMSFTAKADPESADAECRFKIYPTATGDVFLSVNKGALLRLLALRDKQWVTIFESDQHHSNSEIAFGGSSFAIFDAGGHEMALIPVSTGDGPIRRARVCFPHGTKLTLVNDLLYSVYEGSLSFWKILRPSS